jgi:hypothetical protein
MCPYIPRLCPYITRLTEEYICFLYNPCFGCLPRWGASKIGHTTYLYSNKYSFDTTRYKSTKIRCLHITIHSLHTKIRIVFTQGHKKTYNSIWALRYCRCHRPRRILPCLEPHQQRRMLEDINGRVSETFDICSYYKWNN